VKVLNIAELARKNWRFIESYSKQTEVDWRYYSGSPQNIFERLITKPNISRYRAILQALFNIRTGDIVISHLPRMTHWSTLFLKLIKRQNHHLAFSFNFTDLPGQNLTESMKKSFRNVDKFVVFSSFEIKKYSEYFDIPKERFQMLHWAMDTPEYDNAFQSPYQEYYCAVGGEGRDYETLIKTFEKLKHLNLVIVTRPRAIEGMTIPDNVTVFLDLPATGFWAVVQQSKAVIIPLKDPYTACGHISLVGSMKLKKPIITSFSYGTEDYVEDKKNGLVVECKNTEQLVDAIEQLEADSELVESMGNNGYQFSQTKCHPQAWADYIDTYIDEVKL